MYVHDNPSKQHRLRDASLCQRGVWQPVKPASAKGANRTLPWKDSDAGEANDNLQENFH